MRPRKISDTELWELAEQGLGPTAIAQRVGMAKSSVHQRLQQLRLGINKNATMHHAGEILQLKINLWQEMAANHRQATAFRDRLLRALGEGEAAKEERKKLEEVLGENPPYADLYQKAVAECRHGNGLLLKAQRDVIAAQEQAEFQKETIEAIRRVNPEVADQILQALLEASAIRSAIGWC
ncbi:MAG: hypothetical protein C4524_07330 [Candidatus Zixiibacteriota bacterium]|nr:MAG: hypothetical protein C4524_07330 [candidate division Zixibacteria bacterium]